MKTTRLFATILLLSSIGVTAGDSVSMSLPTDFASRFVNLGGTVYVESLDRVTAVFANDVLAARTDSLPYADGSVILFEFAEPVRDDEKRLELDERGQPRKGTVVRIDMMRRMSGASGAGRAGAWEFASFRPDGTSRIDEDGGPQTCAECHLEAGAEKDFVYRRRSWEPVR